MRNIRKTKRELAGLDEAIKNAPNDKVKAALEAEFRNESVRLKSQEAKMKAFCKEKDLLIQNERVQVQGFGRSQAQKAVHANKSSLKSPDKSGIVKRGKGDGKKSNSSINTRQRVHSIGSIDINDEQAIEAVMRKFESHYTSKPIEYACVIDKHGKVYIVRGGELGVDTSVMLGDRMRDSISVHNHPPGTSQYTFSLYEDFGSFFESGERIMRAYDELYGYEVISSENMPSWEDFNRMCNDESLREAIYEKYNIDFDNYALSASHAKIAYVCEHFGISYRRWNRD